MQCKPGYSWILATAVESLLWRKNIDEDTCIRKHFFKEKKKVFEIHEVYIWKLTKISTYRGIYIFFFNICAVMILNCWNTVDIVVCQCVLTSIKM